MMAISESKKYVCMLQISFDIQFRFYLLQQNNIICYKCLIRFLQYWVGLFLQLYAIIQLQFPVKYYFFYKFIITEKDKKETYKKCVDAYIRNPKLYRNIHVGEMISHSRLPEIQTSSRKGRPRIGEDKKKIYIELLKMFQQCKKYRLDNEQERQECLKNKRLSKKAIMERYNVLMPTIRQLKNKVKKDYLQLK